MEWWHIGVMKINYWCQDSGRWLPATGYWLPGCMMLDAEPLNLACGVEARRAEPQTLEPGC
jgi:hypothetical protein